MSGQQRMSGRRALLAAIRGAGSIPRIDLSEQTGISRATVTTITAALLNEGLIEEVQSDVDSKGTRRGRPRVDLKIRGAAHLIAGAKISDRSVSMVLLDFEGNLLCDLEVDVPQSVFDANSLADMLIDVTDRLAAKALCNPSEISALGVGIAGIVDAQRGFVHWSPSLDQRNVELADVLRNRLDLPVFLDNDANLVAVAEKYFGLGQSHSDFIVVTIENGVGMGIVIGSEIYRGTRGCGAEFGHTKVHLDGALCRCGQRGCLEAYVGDYALLREAMYTNGDPDKNIERLLRSAKDNDPVAASIVKRAGRMFALGLANIVNIFDPELIILAGEQMRFDHLYAADVIDAMRESIVQVDKAPPEVVIHKWGDKMWAMGAAAYALEQISEFAVIGFSDDPS